MFCMMRDKRLSMRVHEEESVPLISSLHARERDAYPPRADDRARGVHAYVNDCVLHPPEDHGHAYDGRHHAYAGGHASPDHGYAYAYDLPSPQNMLREP